MNKTQIKQALASAAFDPKNHFVADEAPISYCLLRAREILGEPLTDENIIKVMQLMAIVKVKNEQGQSPRTTRSCNTKANHCIPPES